MLCAGDASVNQRMGDQETTARSVHGSSTAPWTRLSSRVPLDTTVSPGSRGRPVPFDAGLRVLAVLGATFLILHIDCIVALGAGASCFPWGKSPAFSALGPGADRLAAKPAAPAGSPLYPACPRSFLALRSTP
jgi:hypothetical protein